MFTKKMPKIFAVMMSVVLLLTLAACGGGNAQNGTPSKKDEEKLAAAGDAFNQYAPELMRNATEQISITATDWKDDPKFADVVAVSVMGGMAPYQGAPTDPLTVVSQPLKVPELDPSWNISSTLKAALNDKGEVVLLWNEWEQTFPDIDGKEPVRCNMAVSWDFTTMLTRMNDTRQENGMPPLMLETENDGVASPDAENVPSQNSNVGDPNQMTEEEQQAYAETQENVEITEEQADTQE